MGYIFSLLLIGVWLFNGCLDEQWYLLISASIFYVGAYLPLAYKKDKK